MLTRPQPPLALLDDPLPGYIADKSFWPWAVEHFVLSTSAAYNEDHAHLADAYVGFIWTTESNARRGRRILGQAEEPVFRCGRWQKGRQEQQLTEWFGSIPDFLITLDANFCAECSDGEFMALVEHELYHCGQALDGYGYPKFSRDTGLPVYTLRGHDVEEFVGVVKRYGVGPADGKLAELVAAAQLTPLLDSVTVAHCCGNCSR